MRADRSCVHVERSAASGEHLPAVRMTRPGLTADPRGPLLRVEDTVSSVPEALSVMGAMSFSRGLPLPPDVWWIMGTSPPRSTSANSAKAGGGVLPFRRVPASPCRSDR